MKPTEQEINALIQGNIHRDDFKKYLALCLRKWENLKVELEIIDAIMGSICKHWNISRQELIEDKAYMEPRFLMYYIIKKELVLSYGEIGEIFDRPKSYIHKAVDDMVFFVEQNGKKRSKLVDMVNSVKNDLEQKKHGASIPGNEKTPQFGGISEKTQ